MKYFIKDITQKKNNTFLHAIDLAFTPFRISIKLPLYDTILLSTSWKLLREFVSCVVVRFHACPSSSRNFNPSQSTTQARLRLSKSYTIKTKVAVRESSRSPIRTLKYVKHLLNIWYGLDTVPANNISPLFLRSIFVCLWVTSTWLLYVV